MALDAFEGSPRIKGNHVLNAPHSKLSQPFVSTLVLSIRRPRHVPTSKARIQYSSTPTISIETAPAQAPHTAVAASLTRWSTTDHHAALQLSADGRTLTLLEQPGLGTGARESAAARTEQPVPAAGSGTLFYYEVEVLERGTKGHIAVGLVAGDVALSRLPGWEARSWGYHADDGWVFCGSKNGRAFGLPFGSDVVGCGLDSAQRRVFFTKNGVFLGVAFDGVDIGLCSPDGPGVYPSVGMRHAGESVRANFGEEPFLFPAGDSYTDEAASDGGTGTLGDAPSIPRVESN